MKPRPKLAAPGHTPPAHRRQGRRKITRALGLSLAGEDIFVVGHGIHGVARFAGPSLIRVRRGRLSGGQWRCAGPQAKMPENFLHHFPLVNDRYHAHGVLALGAHQRVGVPDLQDQVEPLFRGEFGGRWWRAGWASDDAAELIKSV